MARETLENLDPNDVIIIGLDTDHDESHPLYDERIHLEVDVNLVKNIKTYGVLTPILVRKDGDEIFVLEGRQRVRAARQVNEEAAERGEYGVKVPARVMVATDSRASGIMITSNEHRQEDDVLTKAMKAQRLMAMLNDLTEVANAFGRSEQTIRNWLTLVEADPRVHAAIKAQKISVSAAVEIARLKRDAQPAVLDKLIAAAGANRVSEAAAQKELTDRDDNRATTSDGQGKSGSSERKNKSHNQQGIKRMWLRKALETEAAASLTDEQMAVLQWFSTGEGDDSMWFMEFMQQAEEELSSTTPKRGRKPKKQVTSSASPVLPQVQVTRAPDKVESDSQSPIERQRTREEIAAEMDAIFEDDEDIDWDQD